MKPTWHFGPPPIPMRSLAISALAIAVPVLATLTDSSVGSQYEALLWLIALIPGFLLAYYRGWSGVATGLALAMVAYSLAQVYLVASGQRLPDWPYMLAITVALLLLSLLAGDVTNRLHEAREKAERLALIEPLTGLPNRRYFDLILEREFAAAQRGRDLVVAMFDMDGLKEINDTSGHAAGDEILAGFARVLDSNTRSMNLSARVGGDEFASIVSSATVEGALVFVERVQDATRAMEHMAGRVSVSVGLAAYHGGMKEPEEILAAADLALYRAKSETPGGVAVHQVEEERVPNPA